MLRIAQLRVERQCRALIMFRRSYNQRACYWRMFRRGMPHSAKVYRRIVRSIGASGTHRVECHLGANKGRSA